MVHSVLVVDDDGGIRQLLDDAFTERGFRVYTAKDAHQALALFEKKRPDALVSDVLLPERSGFDLLTDVRALPHGAETPAVLMSGIYKGRRHERRAVDELGALDFLEKPVRPSVLVERVERAIVAGPMRGPEEAVAPSAQEAAEAQDAEARFASFEDKRLERGDLRHNPFAELLGRLANAGVTGGLFLRHEDVKKIVYFKDGAPIVVKSNVLSECLGRVLVQERQITAAVCEASLERMEETGRRQGSILVELGALSESGLGRALRLQLRRKLFNVFSWTAGKYIFNADVQIPTEAVELGMPLAALVYHGLADAGRDDDVAGRVVPYLHHYIGPEKGAEARFEALAFDPEEQTLLALVDGTRSVEDVIKKSRLSRGVAARLIYALMSVNLVQMRRTPKKRRAADAGAGNRPAAPARGPARGPARRPPPRTAAESAVVGRDAIEALRKKLGEWARTLRRQNHFEVLGVSRQADGAELQRAHAGLVRHVAAATLPADAPGDARALAQQIEEQLDEALAVLTAPERRARYEGSLAGGSTSRRPDRLATILSAGRCFEQGVAAAESTAWDAAIGAFKEAIELYPEDGEFYVHLGWAIARGASGAPDALVEGEQHLTHGLRLSPRSDLGHLYMGRLLEAQGRGREAMEHYDAALRCNPESEDAHAALGR